MIHEHTGDVHVIKRRNMTPVVLIVGAALALITLLMSRNPSPERAGIAANQHLNNEGHNAAKGDGLKEGIPMNPGADWKEIDFNAPALQYSELQQGGVDVRGNNGYGIYGIGEEVLFETGKATLRSTAEASLRSVATSIGQRYNGGDIRIYGYTDAQGSAAANQQLAQQRATAVRDWMVQNGGIAANRISLHPVGEARPVASNATEQGRQQNRRVEIVARGAGGTTGGTADQALKSSTDGTNGIQQQGHKDGGTHGSKSANAPANNNGAPPKDASGPY
ncbi:Outer membrane protein OmpA [Cnuella takakiae]|uniref:Outer membrane protein OmpA n=1 Tax=Cnuella takakiae TaxID=1302690 RepID=A0A1M4TG94_9BACT|nr:OmpA family protein [Cnuella takakiae]OLY90732.1 hypothetical protein BUE76_01575 [Cnuella takakiae]SHE43418.1 Outer membrane protein OmpA [Cnuella takakiae]